jgi:hypothetical protein
VSGDIGESDVVWARVDDGFYVGSIPGRFLGCIDRQADSEFVALDVHARPIGTYSHLAAAMSAVWNATNEQASA